MTRGTSAGPTLEEVAALAGVGRGTASRVINGADNVSERSRQAVLDAVAELKYVPNAAARTLMTRRTDTIALVIAESEERIFGEPFFAGVVRGISGATTEAGRQLVLMLSQAGNRTATFESYLSRQHVDGVLLLSLHDDDALPQSIRSRELPMVVGGRAWSPETASVDVDNREGARLATAHLLASGRRHVATITGPLDMGAGRDRYDGYARALADVGREPDDDARGRRRLQPGERAARHGRAPRAAPGPRRRVLRERPDGRGGPPGAARRRPARPRGRRGGRLRRLPGRAEHHPAAELGPPVARGDGPHDGGRFCSTSSPPPTLHHARRSCRPTSRSAGAAPDPGRSARRARATPTSLAGPATVRGGAAAGTWRTCACSSPATAARPPCCRRRRPVGVPPGGPPDPVGRGGSGGRPRTSGRGSARARASGGAGPYP